MMSFACIFNKVLYNEIRNYISDRVKSAETEINCDCRQTGLRRSPHLMRRPKGQEDFETLRQKDGELAESYFAYL